MAKPVGCGLALGLAKRNLVPERAEPPRGCLAADGRSPCNEHMENAREKCQTLHPHTAPEQPPAAQIDLAESRADRSEKEVGLLCMRGFFEERRPAYVHPRRLCTPAPCAPDAAQPTTTPELWLAMSRSHVHSHPLDTPLTGDETYDSAHSSLNGSHPRIERTRKFEIPSHTEVILAADGPARCSTWCRALRRSRLAAEAHNAEIPPPIQLLVQRWGAPSTPLRPAIAARAAVLRTPTSEEQLPSS